MHKKEWKFKKLSPLTVVYVNNGKLGIDNAKSILTVFITFFVDVLEIIKTRNWLRFAEVIFQLLRFGNIIDIAREAWNEVKDLSQAETQELYEHFTDVFDIENDVLEDLIEQAVSTIPRIYQLGLNALDVASGAREIWEELKDIFGGNDEISALSEKLSAAA